jgi:AcrR family transcriptional regulator
MVSTKDRILDAAWACAMGVCQRGGRPDFTMSEVAAKAGLSRQAVYLHFPDRAALVAALQARLAPPPAPAPAEAPSARAALSALLARLADDYPGLWWVLKAGGTLDPAPRLAQCRALVERFRVEGALAPHLSVATAADLLFSLTDPGLWHALVEGRGWDAARYRSHVGYLAVSAITK